jgi:Cdc6-like AAA superfamily ATPase
MEKRIETHITAVGDIVADVKRSQQETRDEQQQEKMLQWLTPTDYSSQQNQLQSERLRGTGLWFLASGVFQSWLQEKGQAVYCPGPPGAGKTHIASLVIHHIQCLDSRPGLAYIYCNFREKNTHTELDFVASLLKQFVRAHRSFPTRLEELYAQYTQKNIRPSPETIWPLLCDTITSNERCFVVVDGLDECREDEGVRDRLLEILEYLRAAMGVNILFTSRYIQQLLDYFDMNSYLRIDIKASPEDMNHFLHDRIPQASPVLRRNRTLFEEVRTAIMLVADGL